MKRLCFGTFATVLKNCMAKRVTQKKLCGAMLLSIAPTSDSSGDDGAVSDLILGKKNLSLTVTDAAPNANPRAISDYFKQNILILITGREMPDHHFFHSCCLGYLSRLSSSSMKSFFGTRQIRICKSGLME